MPLSKSLMDLGFFRIPVKKGNRLILINPENIIYIRACSGYSEIYTNHKKFLSRESISNLATQLARLNFSRIHRSTIINLKFADELIYLSEGQLKVKMMDEMSFKVSERHKKDLLESILWRLQ